MVFLAGAATVALGLAGVAAMAMWVAATEHDRYGDGQCLYEENWRD